MQAFFARKMSFLSCMKSFMCMKYPASGKTSEIQLALDVGVVGHTDPVGRTHGCFSGMLNGNNL